MRLKIASLILLTLIFTLSFTYLVTAPTPFRGISITVPDEVSGFPGETVTIDGEILNFGQWWLHDFNLTLSGLPENYDYSTNPEHWEHLRIIREWNPEKGVYKAPEKFTLTIKIPEDAVGVHLVNITGQEFVSWKKFSNSTQFILRVTSLAEFSIGDIIVPETVTEFEPFNISMNVKNEGTNVGRIDVTVEVPEDWSVDEKTKTLIIEGGESSPAEFMITPTNTSGEITVFAEYPHRETVLNITKIGPYLVPLPAVAPPTALPSGLAALIESIKDLGPIVIGIILVLVVIIAWNIWSIYKGYSSRKKPEKMKKKQGGTKKPKEASESFPQLIENGDYIEIEETSESEEPFPEL